MNESKINEISINGVVYVPKTDAVKTVYKENYVIVRGDRSGVFAGFLESEAGRTVVLSQARQLWYWDGACSVLQIAKDGVSKPQKCKFTVAYQVKILDAIQVMPATEKAFESIQGVAEWKM